MKVMNAFFRPGHKIVRGNFHFPPPFPLPIHLYSTWIEQLEARDSKMAVEPQDARTQSSQPISEKIYPGKLPAQEHSRWTFHEQEINIYWGSHRDLEVVYYNLTSSCEIQNLKKTAQTGLTYNSLGHTSSSC